MIMQWSGQEEETVEIEDDEEAKPSTHIRVIRSQQSITRLQGVQQPK